MDENLINKQFLRSGFKIIFNCCIYISVLLTSNEFNFNIIFFEIGVILSSIREILMMRYLYLNLQQLRNDIDNNSAINDILNYLFVFKLLNCLYLYILIIFQNIDKEIDSRILFIFYTSEVLSMFENREKNIISSNNTIENINNYNINDIVEDNYISNNREAKYRYKIYITTDEFDKIDLCYICYINKGNHTILNCNHDMICEICLFKINKCPICRGDINLSLKLMPIHN